MRLVVVSALLGVSAAWAGGDPLRAVEQHDAVRRDPYAPWVTPAPELRDVHLAAEKRQVGANVIGYYPNSGFWVTVTCSPGQIYATEPTWGACCTPNVGCLYATGCAGREILGIQGGRADCGPSSTCDTVTLLNSRGVVATDVKSIIQCYALADVLDAPKTWYRQQFALTTSSKVATLSETTVSTTTETTTRMTGAPTVTERITVRPSRDAASTLFSRGGNLGELWCLVPLFVALFVGILL